MNCQAFRNAWLNDTDSDTLSHIETCEDCIVWIETQMTTDEEVQFLKEVPLPQANLEERIMQAIYQTAGQSAPPHAATVSLQSNAPSAKKRRTKGFPSFAWVSAAAVLLAVGFLGFQQFNSSDQMQSASQPENSPIGASNAPLAAYSNTVPGQAPASKSDSVSPDTSVQSPALKSGATGQTESKQSPELAREVPSQAAGQSSAASTSPEGMIAMESPKEKASSPDTRATGKDDPPTLARSLHDKPVTDPAAKDTNPALADGALAKDQGKSAESNSIAAVDEPVTAMTVPQNPGADQDVATGNTLVGPPAPADGKAPITLSTFSDVETAAQASDMPVPVLAEMPNGFSLGDISVQYESETSQRVAQLTADYKRNNDWVKVEVVRNKNGKRSLSIPGTFTATQLFSVNGEQAIAVSFQQQGTRESAAQHAVHFNAQSENQSLYVVVTANGVSLEELIEASKSVAWRP